MPRILRSRRRGNRPAMTLDIQPPDLTQEEPSTPTPDLRQFDALPEFPIRQFRRPPRSVLKTIQAINKKHPRTH